MQWALEHGMMVRRFDAGPEIVWLHGLGEWSANFDPIAAHPAFRGFAHVMPDLPGHGRSPWPEEPGGLESLAEQLAAWIGDRCPALIGHSMGGVLATLVAERIAVRAVVNVDGNLSRGDCTFTARVSPSVDDFVASGFAAMRADIYERGRTELALRGYHAALGAVSPQVFHRCAVELVALSESERLAERLAQLRAPALFVAGVPDGVCAYSRGLLDRHEVPWLAVEPAGHWPHCDQPDVFAPMVAGFLREM